MKRKIISIFILIITFLCLILPLSACSESCDIAFIPYSSGEDLYCGSIWQGIEEYSGENNLSCKKYIPSAPAYEAYYNCITKAVEESADIIIVSGYPFESVISDMQRSFPDVKFIIIDGDPSNVASGTIEANTCSVGFAEQQAGYLAGYAMVKEGFSNLGIMGENVSAVLRYSYGFIMGADKAAAEAGTRVNIYYTITQNSAATPEIEARASEWYAEGIEAIFVCGDNIGYSVMSAAGKSGDNAWVIGCDVDRSSESDRVYTCALKSLCSSVKYLLEQYYSGNFMSGRLILGAAEGGVSLPMQTSLFESFNNEQYQYVYDMLAGGAGNALPDENSVLHIKKLPVNSVDIIIK